MTLVTCCHLAKDLMSQRNPCPAQVEQFWLKETHEGNIFHGYPEHVVGPQRHKAGRLMNGK